MIELAVLVPVLTRPQNVAPLVESFFAGCPKNSILLTIINSDDSAEYAAIHAEQPGTRWWVLDVGTQDRSWPCKINEGVLYLADADWYLFAADDVTFVPGWWEATKGLRDDPTVGVIGTNDSATGHGNPRVAVGDHTCHPLVRATYIQDQGTMDQRGLAVHPGYAHWCVDDELVYTAKLRNAWAFCREAVLEHHHPYWDKSIPWDDTYAKGEANNAADMALWKYRAEHVLGLNVR